MSRLLRVGFVEIVCWMCGLVLLLFGVLVGWASWVAFALTREVSGMRIESLLGMIGTLVGVMAVGMGFGLFALALLLHRK